MRDRLETPAATRAVDNSAAVAAEPSGRSETFSESLTAASSSASLADAGLEGELSDSAREESPSDAANASSTTAEDESAHGGGAARDVDRLRPTSASAQPVESAPSIAHHQRVDAQITAAEDEATDEQDGVNKAGGHAHGSADTTASVTVAQRAVLGDRAVGAAPTGSGPAADTPQQHLQPPWPLWPMAIGSRALRAGYTQVTAVRPDVAAEASHGARDAAVLQHVPSPNSASPRPVTGPAFPPIPVDASDTPAQARAAQVEQMLHLHRLGEQVEGSGSTARAASSAGLSPVTTFTIAATGEPPGTGGLWSTNLTPPDEARMHGQVIRGMTAVMNQRGGSLAMRLDPPDLGQLKIQMTIARGSVSAVFHATTDAARELLERSMTTLRTSLERQGLTVERLHVAPPAQPAAQQQAAHDQQNTSAGERHHQHDAADGRSRGHRDERGDDGGQRNSDGDDQRDRRSGSTFHAALHNGADAAESEIPLRDQKP